MTKHVHMGPRMGSPATEGSAQRSHSSCWFVFAALVFYASTIGFGGEQTPWSSIAEFGAKMLYRWDESVAPHVLAPLFEQGSDAPRHGS
jgi:hypothetical protein